jgi:hypothetical protein
VRRRAVYGATASYGLTFFGLDAEEYRSGRVLLRWLGTVLNSALTRIAAALLVGTAVSLPQARRQVIFLGLLLFLLLILVWKALR